MASDITKAAAAPEKMEVVEEYESDPDEVNRSLVMRRREASDDEEEEEEQRESERRKDLRVHIHSDDESDGQGGAPADYDDEEEEEHEGELEEGDVYEEEGYEEEERNNGAVNFKGMEGADGKKSTGGAVGLSANGNDDEKNDVEEEEEKKERNEPFAVPTAGAFYMHDDRFRDSVGRGRHRTHAGRKLWELKDERKWGHDKFVEMTLQERHNKEGRRTSRGRYRGQGKNQGPDQAYPRANRSRAFNNNNNNQNQAPKGVRGRGPRKYDPTQKNLNQAPQPQNKQLGSPLERTSHTNSGRAFTTISNSESVTATMRKLVFASSLNSASPPFYPSGSSNKGITLPQKKDVQSGSTSRNLQNSDIDKSYSLKHANAMHRGKSTADVNLDKLYVGDSGASSAFRPLNSLQMPPSSQSRAEGRGIAGPQQITYEAAVPHNKANRASSTNPQAIQPSPRQRHIQTPAQSTTQQLGQSSASGSQASSPTKTASATNSNDSGEVDSSSESSKLKSALLVMGKGSQGRGSFLYGGAPVMGAAENMSVGHGDQNFPAFLPVMQFGGQHPGGIPAVGMAFPGYVGQPQRGMGNSEMTWLPVLAGAAGALGATYCPPYVAVDGAYNAQPAGQTSRIGSSSKESNTNKPGNGWKPSQRPESGSDEYAQQQNKPQPRRYSAMNLANDVLR